MRMLAALFWITLGMIGCDQREKTVTTTIRSTTPAGSHAVRVSATKASAKFQCIESASGDCEFAVFAPGCSGAADDSRCEPKPVSEFVVAAGTSRQVADLPEGFRFCVGYGKKPVAPSCLK